MSNNFLTVIWFLLCIVSGMLISKCNRDAKRSKIIDLSNVEFHIDSNKHVIKCYEFPNHKYKCYITDTTKSK